MDEDDRSSINFAESEREQDAEPDVAPEGEEGHLENEAESDRADFYEEDDSIGGNNGAKGDEPTNKFLAAGNLAQTDKKVEVSNTAERFVDDKKNQLTQGQLFNSDDLTKDTKSLAFWRPTVRPEALQANSYDIVPTIAAPQSTSINAISITPDLRYWITGGSDGYIRKYDGIGTINGRLALTVAQKHPFVDSVTKAGILMSYWESEDQSSIGRNNHENALSPVYSLAVNSNALWLLSGLESGAINLQSVRHDEGKKICSLQMHSNAVSVLTLANDERSVLSGGWDKNLFDWDLNIGGTIRSFDGSGGQISSIEMRPECGSALPKEADDISLSLTMSSNNPLPPNGSLNSSEAGRFAGDTAGSFEPNTREGRASPAHESLFGGSDAGSLFGETTYEHSFRQENEGFMEGMRIMQNKESGKAHSTEDIRANENSLDETRTEKFRMTPAHAKGDDSTEASIHADTAMVTLDTTHPHLNKQLIDAPEMESKSNASSDPSQRVAEPLSTTVKQEQGWLQPFGAGTFPRDASNSVQSPLPPSLPAADPHLSDSIFLSSDINGTIRLWDKRVAQSVARIGTRSGVPPWCMSACWSPDGNIIYAGRRNGTVEQFHIHKAKRDWEPWRVFRFPAGSGAISAIRPMVNQRHIVCASHDILRLYDVSEMRPNKHSTVPFLIIPGPPRAGVISSLYIDPTSRFLISAAGTRGWEGTSTEAVIGYEINVL